MTSNRFHLYLLFALPMAACTGQEPADTDTATDGGTEPAILIGERFNTPDGRIMYMGAFPDFPDEPIDVGQLTELAPGGDVFACGGYAFFYNSDEGRITRYTVGDDYSLAASGELLVGQEGITGWTGANICASDTSAYLINGSGGRAVEFDPQEMVIVEAFDLPMPEGLAEGLTPQFFEPHIAGDLAYFPVEAVNWDTLDAAPAIVATFDLSDQSLDYTYDEDCVGGLAGHVDSQGNFWRLMGYGSFFEVYGEGNAPDCVLKVPTGRSEFDGETLIDAGDGEPVRDMWSIDDEHALVLVTDAEAPPEDDLWSWWDMPVTPMLVNLVSGARSSYDHVPPVAPQNSRKLVLDGKSYYQIYSYDDDGLVTQVELVELGLDGVETAFTIEGGDILALERIR